MKDSPRWALATADADLPRLLKSMACAIGFEPTAKTTPRLFKVLAKMRPDLGRAINDPKDVYGRYRPYRIDEGAVCVPKSPGLAASPDYPSGHTAYGWVYGLVLAELIPDRATPILQRARSYGESRLICGVHNMSAVEAGRMAGSALVAGLHGSAAFRSDMAAAGREIARLRASTRPPAAPDPAACAAQADLIAKSPYN